MNARLNPTARPAMNPREDMLSRLRRRRPSTALERDFYTSPADFQIDLDMICTATAIRRP